MKKFFISLDRTPERTERFLTANAHIQDFIRAPGIDGSLLNIDDLRGKGFVQESCEFTQGAVGSGLTHVALWGSVAQTGIPAHIFEDDAFLCGNFEQESRRIIAGLPDDWDIILWGNNSDTVLQFDLLPGITQCIATFSQDSVRAGIHSFREMNVSSLPFRLDHTFGICGYAISPLGAEKMIKRCLPMQTINITYPSLNNRIIPASSIDHLMNLHYREMKAYTCLPPLCLTDNQSAQSLNK